MRAAWSGEVAAVRVVLDLGVADREARDKDGSTAFLHACKKGSVKCIGLLAEAGCDTAVTLPVADGHGSRRLGARNVAKRAKDCQPEVFELLDKLERERTVQTVKLEVATLLAANQFAEAQSVLQKALSADPGSATLLALQRQVAERLGQAEQIARQNEAELLAEIKRERMVEEWERWRSLGEQSRRRRRSGSGKRLGKRRSRWHKRQPVVAPHCRRSSLSQSQSRSRSQSRSQSRRSCCRSSHQRHRSVRCSSSGQRRCCSGSRVSRG